MDYDVESDDEWEEEEPGESVESDEEKEVESEDEYEIDNGESSKLCKCKLILLQFNGSCAVNENIICDFFVLSSNL